MQQETGTGALQSVCELCQILEEEIKSASEAKEDKIADALTEFQRIHIAKVHGQCTSAH